MSILGIVGNICCAHGIAFPVLHAMVRPDE